MTVVSVAVQLSQYPSRTTGTCNYCCEQFEFVSRGRGRPPGGLAVFSVVSVGMPRRRRLRTILRQLAAANDAPVSVAPSSAGSADAVEVVDLAAWLAPSTGGGSGSSAAARARAVDAMSRSLNRSGLCLITGHGVSSALREAVHDASLHFFRQPRSTKSKFASREKGTPGWMAEGQQHLGNTLSAETLPADMNEFLIFSTGVEGLGAHERAQAAAEQVAVVPTVPPELPGLFDEYQAAMNRVNLALMLITATALGLSPDYFHPFFSPGQFTLQMRYYPAKPKGFTPEQGQMRIGAHADSNGFTILRTDGKPGLQVRIESDDGARTWVDVVPPAGLDCLAINTGRMIERWTGGFFKAAVHRVTAEAINEERLSLAFFSSPNKSALIETVGPEAGASGYPQVIAGELSDAHYMAAYSTGVGADGEPEAANSALRKLGEQLTD